MNVEFHQKAGRQTSKYFAMCQTRHTTERPRGGFTLIEVLLALVIILVMTALAWTPLISSWSEHRLKAATEDVRSVLGGTRIHSLENDAIWQFRFEPGGDHFLRIPYRQSAEDSKSASGLDGRMSLILPEGITFSEGESLATATRESLTAQDVEGLPDSGELSGISWSAPILFYPDGSATEAEFQVVDEEAGEMTIRLRDLTGGVRVSRGNPGDEDL